MEFSIWLLFLHYKWLSPIHMMYNTMPMCMQYTWYRTWRKPHSLYNYRVHMHILTNPPNLCTLYIDYPNFCHLIHSSRFALEILMLQLYIDYTFIVLFYWIHGVARINKWCHRSCDLACQLHDPSLLCTSSLCWLYLNS